MMTGKVNQGMLNVPADNRLNVMDQDEIANGDEIVRIRQDGHDSFYRLENWVNWMNSRLSQFPRNPVHNPRTGLPVLPEQIDIFTARVRTGGYCQTRRTRKARKTWRKRR
jgi:hypothetical protein